MKLLHYTLSILLLIFCAVQTSFGQLDPVYSQYMFNQLAINPAYAGSRGGISTTLMYRDQWTGVEGSPKTQFLSLHTPISSDQAAIGVSMFNDSYGVQSRQGLLMDYAYRRGMGKGYISAALRGSVSFYQARWSQVSTFEENDGSFASDEYSAFVPNAGLGFYYADDENYLGLAFPQLLKQRMVSTNSTAVPVQVFHMYVTAGRVFTLNDNIKLKPSTLFRYSAGNSASIDLNMNVLLLDKIWAGVSYRTSKSLVFLLEYQYNREFKFGYSFDQGLGRLKSFGSTHEFLLTYDFTLQKSKIKSTRYF